MRRLDHQSILLHGVTTAPSVASAGKPDYDAIPPLPEPIKTHVAMGDIVAIEGLDIEVGPSDGRAVTYTTRLRFKIKPYSLLARDARRQLRYLFGQNTKGN